jgi:hypothetical protein
MTRVSVCALRISNPSLRVVVACDAISAAALERSGDLLRNDIDELIICDTPDGSASYRNRHVKTRLREILKGRFISLDADTIVRGDLSPIFSLNTDIAAACNHSEDEFGKQVCTEDAEILSLMKWQVGERVYINGGVLFYNDTAVAHRFAALWHQKWLECVEGGWTYRDQPALNAALFDAQPRLILLPHRFNAQFKCAPHVAENAIIWHFYTSDGRRPLTSFEMLVEQIIHGKRLRGDVVAGMIRCSHPWRRAFWFDDWIARGLARKECVDPGYEAWFWGRRIAACRYWTIRAIKNFVRNCIAKTRVRTDRSLQRGDIV